jgi:hypothetical protein
VAALNLALRFLLELAGIVALWVVGWGVSSVLPVQLLAAFGLAGALVVAWAFVVAPKAANRIPQATRMLIGTGLLLVVAALLALTGQVVAAAVFAVLNLVNTGAVFALGGPEAVTDADR